MTIYRKMAGGSPGSANLLIGTPLRRAERATFARAPWSVRSKMGDYILHSGVFPWHGPKKVFSPFLVKTYMARRLIVICDSISDCVEFAGKEMPRDQIIGEVSKRLTNVYKELGNLGFRFTYEYAERLFYSLEKESVETLTQKLDVLRERYDDELKGLYFLHVKTESLQEYNDPLSAWGIAADNFGSGCYDMEEASKCFALERYTASVMHSMRVLEIGLVNLCRALKVRYDEKSWNTLLVGLEKKWKETAQRKNKPPSWKQDEQFYSEAFAEFRHFKDAWRNHAMHARSTFDEERARVVVDHVRSFMRHLATKLKE